MICMAKANSLFVTTCCIFLYAGGQCTVDQFAKRLTKSFHKVDEIFKELSGLISEAEICNAQLENVTKNLNSVCQNVTELEKSEVNLNKIGNIDQTIRVDVKDDYSACVVRPKASYAELYSRIWCLRVSLWRSNHYNNTIEDQAEDILFGVNMNSTDQGVAKREKRRTWRLSRIVPRDITQPGTGYRIRKEYRALTVKERQKYHAAVRELKADSTFNCFALVHRKGIRLKGVHQGEAFLPWHRVFLALYEEALRQIDPDVSLPYWDSTIDDNMASPTMSVMWDNDHLGKVTPNANVQSNHMPTGTGFGNVNDGPFANFTSDNPLKRQIGNGHGRLMRQRNIDALLRDGLCELRNISRRLEGVHNGVHRWVGGTMAGSLSASDPVFYMHHAFIDFVWEKYREKQSSAACGGIDPGTDYPIFDNTSPRPTPRRHMPEEQMDGMEFLANRVGIENYWTTNWYGYEERPSCSNNCSNSEDMFCDEDLNLCVGEQTDDPGNVPLLNMPQRLPASMTRVSFSKPVSDIRQEFTTRPAFSARPVSSNICRTQPYDRSCLTPDPPATIEETASAMINRNLRMPDEIARIEMKMKKNRDKVYETPPESEPAFFREMISNDCRTSDTAVYDLLVAMIQGKRIGRRKTVLLPQ